MKPPKNDAIAYKTSIAEQNVRNAAPCTAHLHERIIEPICVYGIVHVCHDLARQAPGLQIPGDNSSAARHSTIELKSSERGIWLLRLAVKAMEHEPACVPQNMYVMTDT